MTVQILDVQRQALIGAVVSVASSPDSRADIAYVTDETGRFDLQVSEPGNYPLLIALNGVTHRVETSFELGKSATVVIVGGEAMAPTSSSPMASEHPTAAGAASSEADSSAGFEGSDAGFSQD